MKKAVFIPARLGSSRLPNKHLMKIKNKYCIEYVIERAKLVNNADIVVLTTTNLPEDDSLEEIALKNNILVYRGDADDIIQRFYSAATHFNVDFFVVASGDNLFSEPELLSMAIEQYKDTNADLIDWQKTNIVCGSFNYGIKSSALKYIILHKETKNTEMIWTFFNKDFSVEQLQNIPSVYKRPEIRATLDYIEDYEFFKRVIELATDYKINISSLREIIELLDLWPELTLINRFRHEDWAKNQANIIRSVK